MWILLLIIIKALFLYAWLIEPNNIEINELEIKLANLPREFEGFKILQLTDIHGRRFIQGRDHLIKVVNRQEPDLIVITGDLIYQRSDLEEMLRVISQLKAPVGIYCCPGNHEYKLPIDEVARGLERAGAIFLRNEARLIARDGVGGFQLLGLDDYYHGSPLPLKNFRKGNNKSRVAEKEGADREKADSKADREGINRKEIDGKEAGRKGTDGGKPRILLSHSPDIAGEAVENELDLVIAGHTHGGQICLPFFGALYTSCKNYWKEYESGYYREKNTQLYVSRGLGCSLLPLRFLCPPEIAVFKLTAV